MVQGLGLGSFIAVAQLQSLVRNLDPKSLAVWLKKKKKRNRYKSCSMVV